MKAKLVKENLSNDLDFLNDYVFPIQATFETIIDGDDVEYEGENEETIEEIESYLGHDIEDLSDEDYLLSLTKEEIMKIYDYLMENGWL